MQRKTRFASNAMLLALASFAASPVTFAQTATPATKPDKPEAPARTTAFVVKVRAMDSGHAGRAIRRAFEQCAEAKATGIVLIVGASSPWRADVVRDVLREMNGCKVPTMVLVDDFAPGKPRQVELGPALLAVAAAHWGMDDPVTTIRVSRDDIARSLVADRTDWVAIEHDIREIMTPHATRRGWADGFAEVLTWPLEQWWAIESRASRTALETRLAKGNRPTQHSGERTRVLCKERTADEPFASFVVGLPSLTGSAGTGAVKADDATTLCKAAGLKAPMTHDLEIEGSVDDTRSQAFLAHEELILIRKQTDAALDTVEDKATRAHDAKAQALAQSKPLDRADTIIADLEAALADYPEVLRSIPPGKTPTGSSPAAQPARWRSLIQNHRDAMVKLRDRAEAITGSK